MRDVGLCTSKAQQGKIWAAGVQGSSVFLGSGTFKEGRAFFGPSSGNISLHKFVYQWALQVYIL